MLGIYEVPTKRQAWQQMQGIETWIKRKYLPLRGQPSKESRKGYRERELSGVFIHAYIRGGRDRQSRGKGVSTGSGRLEEMREKLEYLEHG